MTFKRSLRFFLGASVFLLSAGLLTYMVLVTHPVPNILTYLIAWAAFGGAGTVAGIWIVISARSFQPQVKL